MKRHSLDPFSLVSGATFTVFGFMFLVTRVDITNVHLQWVWPIPIIALGALIIGLAIRGNRRQEEEAED